MSGLNLLVFRADQRRVSGNELKTVLAGQLERLGSRPSHDALLAVLLLAGELECGMADADARSARPFELLTDGIAERVFAGALAPSAQALRDAALTVSVSRQLSISVPEGFAYYALDPLAYAQAVDLVPAPANRVMVVGIRSIGTTLSAVVAAAVRLGNMEAWRITVRPEGHPYDRRTEFSPSQLAGLQQAISSGATFVIVDEGPGLSGSSFLSVAEALELAGVPRQRIVLLGSHAPNIDLLCAPDAARRWQRFHYQAVASEPRRPAQAASFIGAGQWRGRLFDHESEWPASCTTFERLKYLSRTGHDGQRLFKFAGLGHYGDRVFVREQITGDSGFGPEPRQEGGGFVSYPWIDGRPMSTRDLAPGVLERLAEYCAFRLRAFAVEFPDLDGLQQMVEHNLHELKFDMPAALRLEHPVIADGRMQPHEWLLTQQGAVLKSDSGSHGDDHFFPGPTDIAWDLAGAMVEWRMDEDQANGFLDLYRRASGDDASARIEGFIHAYAVFRCAYSMMAANAMRGSEEQFRMERAADGYRSFLAHTKARDLAAL